MVARESLGTFIQFHGFKPVGEAPPEELMPLRTYRMRDEMENDPSHKQLIPYIVLRDGERIFRYWRTKRGGESRLHHLYSIGIGGHINPRDENLFTEENEILAEAAMRELLEEVEIPGSVELKHVGYINDDETEVGKVHLGIVYEAWVSAEKVRIRESALGRGEWKTIQELKDGVVYESWSEFVIHSYLLCK
ncbi:MAG: hypothetical protein C4527_07500 [Candidatus Omnitrophota bacterium]|nr:MAG: hypothetical protein C4527_07500 [Candidatus Omnitrophota bacterium]